MQDWEETLWKTLWKTLGMQVCWRCVQDVWVAGNTAYTQLPAGRCATPRPAVHLMLLQVLRSIREGADVRGFYYWTLNDNFEWNVGEWRRPPPARPWAEPLGRWAAWTVQLVCRHAAVLLMQQSAVVHA
jgi:hypothetical protein